MKGMKVMKGIKINPEIFEDEYVCPECGLSEEDCLCNESVENEDNDYINEEDQEEEII